MARRRRVGRARKPRVDVARRLLAMPDGDRDVALGRHHIAACEDTGVTGHHVRRDLHHPIIDLQPGNALQQTQVDILPECEHKRIGLDRFELARGLRKPALVELHFFDRNGGFIGVLDGGKPLHHDAFLQGLFDLEIVRGHLFARAPVDNDGFCAKPLGAARHVNRGIAAAVDDDATTQ